jgi:hypothetical protein
MTWVIFVPQICLCVCRLGQTDRQTPASVITYATNRSRAAVIPEVYILLIFRRIL